MCAASGRRSLSAAAALSAGTEHQREAAACALVALGYPEAMSSPGALGATLRAVRGRADGMGRRIAKSMSRGGARWYVVLPIARTVAS